ncbi:MAG: ABC transporter permease [Bacteroidales bacterium]|nr:ABC transporter permease [Bacteroidales bacterium]
MNPRFPLFIAARYLISRKSHNIIHIIAAISASGVLIGSMALIVVLSVFNGFEHLVKTLVSSFQPDIMITPRNGKTFNIHELPEETICRIPGVSSFTGVVEENALLKYRNEQYIATIKGVSDDFLKENPLDTMILSGRFSLHEGSSDLATAGYLVAYQLGINLNDFTTPLMVYVPRRTSSTFTRMDQAFNMKQVLVSGVFSVQQEYDSRYVIVPLSFARELLGYTDEVTSVEIRLSPQADTDAIIAGIGEIAGKNFLVRDRYRQQELLYRIMRSEKYAIFFILSFILAIATFNMIGTMSILVLEKRRDIAVLFSLGSTGKNIRQIFITEGLLMTLAGCLAGLALGAILCWMQQEFGLIRLGNEASAFIVPFYPVKMMISDFALVLGTVICLGMAAAWIPVRQLSARYVSAMITELGKHQ